MADTRVMTRTRGQKVHFWANKEILLRFESTRDRMGFSRDGALERAMLQFVAGYAGRKSDKGNGGAL